jgi:hypothetical protein
VPDRGFANSWIDKINHIRKKPMDTPPQEVQKPRIRLTIIALRISEVIYFLVALCSPFLFTAYTEGQDQIGLITGICTAIFGIGLVVFIELVIRNLKQQKFWAWVAALCLSGLYVPSAFLPLGIMGLIGLLDPETRAAFGVGPSPQTAPEQ